METNEKTDGLNKMEPGYFLFAGSMFIGLGTGIYFNAAHIGVLIGMGVGMLLLGFSKIIRKA